MKIMRSRYFVILFLLVNIKIVAGQEILSPKDTIKITPSAILQLEKPDLAPLSEIQFKKELLLENGNSSFLYQEYNFGSQKNSKVFINQVRPYLLPAALLSLSLYSMSDAAEGSIFDKNLVRNNLRLKLPPNYDTDIDDFLQFAPLAITGGLKLAGIRGENDGINSVLVAAKAHMLNDLIVTSLKSITNIRRPDNSSYTSFPSGHTANAFCNATIMHMEFGEISPWYSVAAYSMATATGAMRMMNDKHWLPDVLAGAAIGITTTRFVYATHRYKWGKKPTNLVVVPSFTRKQFGLNLAYTF